MAWYEFEDVKTGDKLEIQMSMNDAVDIGKVIKHEGRKVRRLISSEGMPAMREGLKFPFPVHSLHPDTAGVRHRNANGVAVMTCAADIRAVHKATGMGYEGLSDTK